MAHRLIIPILVVVSLFALAACDIGFLGGGDKETSTANETAPPPTEPITDTASLEPTTTLTPTDTLEPPTPTPEPTTTPTPAIADLDGRTLVVGVDPSYPPMEYVDPQSGELAGLSIDMMHEIGRLINITVDYDTSQPFDTLLETHLAGQFDLVLSTMAVTPDREQQVQFSDPYLVSGQVVSVRQDNTTITSVNDLSPDHVIGVEGGTTGDITLIQMGFAESQIRRYDNLDILFDALAIGNVDAVVADGIPTARYVTHFSEQFKVAGQPFEKQYYAIIVPATDDEVEEAINKALAELESNGTLAALIQKWGLQNVAMLP